jgi:hypothetical protein
MTAAPAPSAAAQLFVDLDYRVGVDLRGCPDVAAFRRDVSQQLGYDPFRAAAAKRLSVSVRATEHGSEGRVEWTDQRAGWEGDRRLSAGRDDCAKLAQGMAFAVAVQIQLLAVTASTARAGPPVPPPATIAVSAPAAANTTAPIKPGAPIPPAPASRAPTRWSFATGLGPSVGWGLASGPSTLGRLFVTGRLARTSLELGAEAALTSTMRVADGSGFAHSFFAATAAACRHLGSVAACGLGKVGEIRGRGLGVDRPASPSGLVTQAGLRVALSHDLGKLCFAMLRADALAMLTPWTVTLNRAAVWSTPRFGASIGIDLAVRFR